jgi:hypothetical protein
MRFDRVDHGLTSICAVTSFESSSDNNSHHTLVSFRSGGARKFGRIHELLRQLLGHSHRCWCGPELRGYSHQVGKRIGLHLLHYFAAVCLHRDFADTEFSTNLFI